MSTVIDAMRERRSIRAYTGEVPPRELIDQVIDAGLWAASGMNRQGPIVVAVTNRALRDRLSAMNAAVMGRPAPTRSTARRSCSWCLRRATSPTASTTGAS